MSDVKKNKSEVGQTASSNLKNFSMPSLKDIVSGISEVESAQCDESLSKKVDLINEKAEKVNSNTQLYKQAGNSIVVNVLEAILKELLNGK